MTKPEERCVSCVKYDKAHKDVYINGPVGVTRHIIIGRGKSNRIYINGIQVFDHPCSCDFITLPKRSGSKSEMPAPEEILERLWARDLAVTGKVFFIDGTFTRTFIEAKYVLT